jgi:hypothetical protein
MAYTPSEQAVSSIIAPLLNQLNPVILEKVACCRYLAIAVFQGLLGSPVRHGSWIECGLFFGEVGDEVGSLSCPGFSDTIQFK